MQRTILILIVTAVVVFLGFQATGNRLRGNATTASEIPVVGRDLGEIQFLSPASYSGFEHPHGGGSLTLSGTATKESLEKFCRRADISLSLDGTEILDRSLILEQLKHFNMSDTPVSATDATFVLAGMGGRFHKLFGTYEPGTKRFHIHLQFVGVK